MDMSILESEKNKFLNILQEFEELFGGTLGDWDCNPVSLQLEEGEPNHTMVDHSQYQKACRNHKKGIQRLCNLGVLKWQADSEWASPIFIIPKKDNTVRVVSDFREINNG